MRVRRDWWLLAAALLAGSGCVSAPREGTTYESCTVGTMCRIHGIASYQGGEHAPIARLDLPDGQCLNVSVPSETLERLRSDGPAEMTVVGRVYGEPRRPDGGEIIIEIGGRRIGYGLCGYSFVFVPDP